MKSCCVASALSVLLIFATTTHAQSREVIQNCKAATALVDLSAQGKIATAFCIDENGIFVTNYHVVDKVNDEAEITLVLNAARSSEKKFTAKVIRTDEENDLALLRAEAAEPFQALELGDDDELFETMRTVVSGFPFGKGLAIDKESFPAMSVNVGRITAIRSSEGQAKLIQLDAELNPGNSGGAVTDEDGKVIGVVSFGLLATGINFAIPVNKLKLLMQKPDVNITYPEITFANKNESVDLEVALTPLLTPLKNPNVSVEIQVEDEEPRTVPLERNGMRFHVSFVPQPLESSRPPLVDSTIRFSNGEITTRIEDRKIAVDAKPYDLSAVSSISLGEEGTYDVEFADGSTQTGKVRGLDEMNLDFGETQLKADLSAATEVLIDLPDSAAPQVSFTIIVKDSETEIKRVESVAEDSFTSIRPFEGPEKRVRLPGTITDAVAAGGGRLLLLPIPQQKKLAVFDCTLQKILTYIPMASDNCLVAGTLQHAVLFDRINNVIERWNLATFKRERSIKPPFDGVIRAVAAGSASSGPVLVLWAVGTGALDRTSYTTIDVATMTEKKLTPNGRFNHSYRDTMHIRASANGRAFGMWCTSHSPQGIYAARLLDGKLEGSYEHDSVGHVVPGPDGMLFFTGIGLVFSNRLKAESRSLRSKVPCVPTTHPKLYLTVPADPGANRNLGSKPFEGVQPGIHSVGSSARLVEMPPLKLRQASGNRSRSSDFTLDKRVIYLMQSNALITIPYSNEEILIQEFDLMKELEDSETDYFFVTSTPNLVFEPGSKWKYKLTVASKHRKFRYELLSGPTGMKISRTGEVSWTVPEDFPDKSTHVIINVSNAIDQVSYDTFTLQNAAAD